MSLRHTEENQERFFKISDFCTQVELNASLSCLDKFKARHFYREKTKTFGPHYVVYNNNIFIIYFHIFVGTIHSFPWEKPFSPTQA